MEALSNLTLDNWLRPAAPGDSVVSCYRARGLYVPTVSLPPPFLCSSVFSDVTEPQLSFRHNKQNGLVLLLHRPFILQTTSSGSGKDDTTSADSRLVQGQGSRAENRIQSSWKPTLNDYRKVPKCNFWGLIWFELNHQKTTAKYRWFMLWRIAANCTAANLTHFSKLLRTSTGFLSN